MHLSAQELVELLHGDTPAARLGRQLDHLDRCRECADTFQLLVSLRAHRQEALGALAVAPALATGMAPRRPAEPIALPTPPPLLAGWAGRHLRLAASLALAALLGLAIWSAPIALQPAPVSGLPAALAQLATDELVVGVRRPEGVTFTRSASGDNAVDEAIELLQAGEPAAAAELLASLSLSPDDPFFDYRQLYLGVALYLDGETEAALASLRQLEDNDEPLMSRQARWYEANGLLRLGRAGEALVLLDQLTPKGSGIFQVDAADLAAQIRALLATNAKEGEQAR
ncbi:MAG: hypothetical protein ACE5HV_15050 [Acidobacteriota bacterium]